MRVAHANLNASSCSSANSQCLSNVFLNSVRCDNSCGRVLDRLADGADRRRRQGEVRKGGRGETWQWRGGRSKA